MSDTCPTVKIKDDSAPGGYVVINEEDFDEKIHTQLTARAEAKAEAAVSEAAKPKPKEDK